MDDHVLEQMITGPRKPPPQGKGTDQEVIEGIQRLGEITTWSLAVEAWHLGEDPADEAEARAMALSIVEALEGVGCGCEVRITGPGGATVGGYTWITVVSDDPE